MVASLRYFNLVLIKAIIRQKLAENKKNQNNLDLNNRALDNAVNLTNSQIRTIVI